MKKILHVLGLTAISFSALTSSGEAKAADTGW